MNIVASRDNTGFAPNDSLWSAIDADTYDGAEDSHCPIGVGSTETDAVIDLLGQMEEEANVRLICAAPDLLAAAVKALAECCDLVGTDAGNALEAAISKYEGRTP